MTYETRMDLCDPHPNLLKLKFARLRLDLSGCFTPKGHSIKAQNVIGNGAAPLAQPARGTHDGR